MDKLFEKISSYNLLNNLIPGGVFCFLLHRICSIDILGNSVVENLFIYYFVGMVISRVGSILIEPIAKKIKLVSYVDYNDYIVASKKDPKIDILLETSNLYRTIVAGGLLILIVKLYICAGQKIQVFSYATPYIIVIFFLIIFLFSFRKQTQYIKRRVDKATQDTQGEDEK